MAVPDRSSGAARLASPSCWRSIAPVLALVLALAACSENKVGTIKGVLDAGLASADGFQIDSPIAVFDSGTVEEVAPLPGQFLAPCETSDDCDSAICVESADGKVCSIPCTDTCPKGFACAQHLTPGGDNVYECVPRFRHLCDPCTESKDCNGEGESGNVCVGFGNTGSFCGAKCNPLHPECPGGSTCQQVTDPASGATVNQCLPQDGECSCSKNAQTLALKTACFNQNLTGKCSGVRQCSTGGLSSCNAPVPRAEECNGVDDDCNGKTDDFTDSSTCTIKNEFGQCKGKVIDCVDGKAVCDGPQPKPEACNGVDDDCNGQTDEGLCEDGDPCTKGICNTDGSCQQQSINGLECDDGTVCTKQSKCLGGQCIGGDALNCDDNDPCTTDSCDPFTGCVHSPASDAVCTDDGNACTQDLCQSGKCVHPQVNDGSACADDGIACTADVCLNAQCKHNPAEGIACADDGNPCTSDVCKAGACSHPFGSGACEDGNPCTLNDACSAGVCKPGLKDGCDDGNPCTKDSCDPGQGCLHTANDFAACTSSSADCPTGQCANKQCFPKPNVTCEAKFGLDLCQTAKVAGVCSGNGKCVVTQAPPQYTCPGCNGICIKCFINICLPLN